MGEGINIIKRPVNIKHYEQYRQMLADPDYSDVHYYSRNGGVRAVQGGHNLTDDRQNKYHFPDGDYSGKELEILCSTQLARQGHSSILLNENGRTDRNGNLLASLDMKLDGELMDIASVVSADSGIVNILSRKTKQLNKYLQDQRDSEAHSLCLYFHDPATFSVERINDGIDALSLRLGHKGFSKQSQIDTIVCVVKGAKDNVIIKTDKLRLAGR